MATASSDPDPNNLKVRRPGGYFFLVIAQTVLMLGLAVKNEFPARAIWGGLFVLGVALTIRALLKPQYMELSGTKLTIYGHYFRTKTIDIGDIERIEVEPGPFSHSKIVLKENKGYVKFDDYQVRNEEFAALVKALNVPVL